MATLIPPPSKKQKRLDAAATAAVNYGRPEGQAAPAPSIIVQFTSSKDGSPVGPPIRLPADTDRRGLELLTNQLAKAQKAADRSREDDEDDDENMPDDETTPYSFSVAVPGSTPEGEKQRVPVLKDIQQILKSNEKTISIEDVLEVVCEPEAVFKVRQINRCSTTLSGKSTSARILQS